MTSRRDRCGCTGTRRSVCSPTTGDRTHGFIYANITAQHCFEYGWDEFVGTPSRLSARVDGQQDRDQLLARVEATGLADGYRGLRVAGSGRRFWIEDVVMWNLVDGSGTRCGQAALFPRWSDAD